MNFNYVEQIRSKSNSELVEIYTNPSDYQPEFVEFAKQEIGKRNIPLDALDGIKEKHEEIEAQALAIGKQEHPFVLAVVGLSAIVGGIPAIICGYIYAYSTRLSIYDEKYFVYNKTTRNWGLIFFYFGITVLLSLLWVKFN